MNIARSAVLAALCSPALLFSGCIRTFHPLYTADTIIHEPALAGTWGDKPESKERWIFAPGKDGCHRLTVIDENGRKGEFLAVLTRIGDRRFLDVFPQRGEEEENNGFLQFHLVPHHSFFWVKALGATLQLAAPHPERVQEILKRNPNAIPHAERDRNDLVLTGTTAQLRAFVARELAGPDSFTDPSDLKRLSDGGLR